MNAREIELAIARFVGWRHLIIVPNVSWGLGLDHECDLLVMWPRSGYCEEYEIKVTRADLLRDRQKRHQHLSPYIRALWFAVPAELATDLSLFPDGAGVVAVGKNGRCRVARPAKKNRLIQPLPDDKRWKLLHLGCMRIWTLKQAIETAAGRKDQRKRIIEGMDMGVKA